ncbi:MAG: discoidin domain-containing protein, partial [Streptomyces sp.]|uniref:discoidin domain-containing protein n=1 Tax=Streptomyces sp. TaxID=1931 RepID=UPI003D6C581A
LGPDSPPDAPEDGQPDGAPDGEPDGRPDEGPRNRPSPTPALTVRLPEQRPLDAVTVQTGPGSGTRARVEAHVPGEGWRRLGALSGSGWTQTDGHGVRADALRLAWSPDSREPVVHEITPWFADSPDASLTLSRDQIYVPIGGGTSEVTAELRARRPADVRGRVTAKAPDGFTVHTPDRTEVPRGGTARVRVRIEAGASVRPGTHEIPVSFGGERRTLTVSAFPRTGGPDLARTAEAASSADETPDFPASAVNDGRKGTRWSSPAEDGEWLQLRLRRPTRVGELVLHWQDAYAKRYRVQVSPDGKRWRTAATVGDGRGGRETVRMDAPADTRYVRVQGEERATRFGYSLWSVEAYAVRGRD